MMKRGLKILKLFLPYGIIALNREYEDYKKRSKNKNKEYIFDAIFSVGIACRPAYYLQKHGIRLCANPLDWMMSYSLDTVIHLYQTKFTDFFVDFEEDKRNSHWLVDTKNCIVSMHYPDIANSNEVFREVVKKRFEKVNKILLKANKICFITNRSESFENLSKFLKEMGGIYSGEITFINIRNNKEINDINLLPGKRISEKLKLIEYEFNDVHPDGNDKDTNPDYWIGNVYLWDRIVEKISLKSNFLLHLLRKNNKQ